MTDIRVIEAGKYNKILAAELKNVPEFKKPEFIDFVKSGVNKERPILDIDFWHKRSASILRQIYIRKIVGVSRLRTRYGGRKDRGMAPPEFRKSGGKIVRLILQQAESAGFLEKSKEKKAGRKLTEKGIKFLEDLAK